MTNLQLIQNAILKINNEKYQEAINCLNQIDLKNEEEKNISKLLDVSKQLLAATRELPIPKKNTVLETLLNKVKEVGDQIESLSKKIASKKILNCLNTGVDLNQLSANANKLADQGRKMFRKPSPIESDVRHALNDEDDKDIESYVDIIYENRNLHETNFNKLKTLNLVTADNVKEILNSPIKFKENCDHLESVNSCTTYYLGKVLANPDSINECLKDRLIYIANIAIDNMKSRNKGNIPNNEKAKVIQLSINNLRNLENPTKEDLQNHLLQLERNISHKRWGFRDSDKEATSYVAVKNQFQNLRKDLDLPYSIEAINSNVKPKQPSNPDAIFTYADFVKNNKAKLKQLVI